MKNGEIRTMEDPMVISLRISREIFEQLSLNAAEVDVNTSTFVRTCILVASPLIKANPRLINFFSESISL